MYRRILTLAILLTVFTSAASAYQLTVQGENEQDELVVLDEICINENCVENQVRHKLSVSEGTHDVSLSDSNYKDIEDEIFVSRDLVRNFTLEAGEEEDPKNEAFFDIQINSFDNDINQGDTAEVDYTVTNTGEKTDEQDIGFRIDGNLEESEILELEGSDSESGTFKWNTEETISTGDYLAKISSDDDSASRTINVKEKTADKEPANFDVEITGTNSPVTKGEELKVDYRVENTGEEQDTQEIELRIRTRKDSEKVSLDGGEIKRGTLYWKPSRVKPGVYEAIVSSNDDYDQKSVEVRGETLEKPEARLDVRPNPAKVNEKVTFDASESFSRNSDGIDQYYYDFEDNGEWDIITSSSSVSRRFNEEGERTAVLMVKDYEGKTDTVTRDFTVEEVKDEPNFEVNLQGSNSPVMEGDTVSLDYRVENTGDLQDTQQIELIESDETVDSNTVTLKGQNSVTGTLEWETDKDDVGSSTLIVKSEDSSDFTTVTVESLKDPEEDQPFFDVKFEGVNSPVNVGDTLKVDYTVENTGDIEGTREIDLFIDSDKEDTETISLEPGDSTTGTLSWNTSGAGTGPRIAALFKEGVIVDSRNIEVVEDEQDEEDEEDEQDEEARKPVANLEIDPDNAEVFENVKFDASESFGRDGEKVDLYYYDFENDGDWELVTTRDEVSRSFRIPGEKTARLMVEDTDGKTDTITGNYEITGDFEEDDEAVLDVYVSDTEGDRLEDVRVTAENGETVTRYTDNDGEVSFELESDRYDVEAVESGYFSDSATVRLDDGEEESVFLELEEIEDTDNFGDTRIEKIDFPSEVCRGRSMRVDFDIVNREDSFQNFQVTGRGLSSISVRNSILVESDDTERTFLRFTNVQGDGEEEFTLRATNGEVAEVTRTVEVNECKPDEDAGRADRITVDLEPKTVVAGQAVRVNGFVDGAEGRKNVELSIDGQDAGRVTTEPDGYYQAFIRPDNVGTQTVTVSTDSTRASGRLEVLPTSNVYNAKVKNKPVFQGEEFQVCGDVESQITPKVMLLRNGEVVDTKDEVGDVCFERKEFQRGEIKYEIRSGARGQIDSASTEIEILETDVEATNFPDQVAQVRSDPGIVKVELYNNQKEMQRYDLSLENLPDGWTDQSDRQVILRPGERREAFFYMTPEAEGERTAELTVEREGTVIHEQDIDVVTGGTTEERGFFSVLLQRLGLS